MCEREERILQKRKRDPDQVLYRDPKYPIKISIVFKYLVGKKTPAESTAKKEICISLVVVRFIFVKNATCNFLLITSQRSFNIILNKNTKVSEYLSITVRPAACFLMSAD